MKEDYSNGILDSLAVPIGGVKQWLNIRGKKKDAPILLVIHGGPGSTLMGLSHTYQRPWEEFYTVVNWDQRCSGKTASVSGTKSPEVLTVDRMLQDTLEVVDYLRARFHRDRVVILGHSWGTMLGALFTLKYPDRLTAYISTGTMVCSRAEYEIVPEQLHRYFLQHGDSKSMKQADMLAEARKEKGVDWDWILALNKLVIRAGYSSTRVSTAAEAWKYEILPLLRSPDYTLRDALHLFGCKAYLPLSEHEIPAFDLYRLGTEYAVPVYYINGDTDWQTPVVLSKAYAEKTVAPDTASYILKNCAHCWDLDAPEQMTALLCGDIYRRLQNYI